MLVRSQKYLLDNRNSYLLKLKKSEKYLSELNKATNIEVLELAAPPPEDIGSQSFVENKLNKTMTHGEYMAEVTNLSYYHRNISDRQIHSMVWEDLARRGSKGSPHNARLESQNLTEAIAEPVEVLAAEPEPPAEDDGQQLEADRRE